MMGVFRPRAPIDWHAPAPPLVPQVPTPPPVVASMVARVHYGLGQGVAWANQPLSAPPPSPPPAGVIAHEGVPPAFLRAALSQGQVISARGPGLTGVVYFTGFETGDATDAFLTSGTWSVQSGVARSGGYALLSSPGSGSAGFWQLRPPQLGGGPLGGPTATSPTVQASWLRVYFRYGGGLSAADEEILTFRDAGGSSKLTLYLTPTGVLRLRGAGVLLATGTSVLGLGSWYRLEVYCETGNPAGYSLWIDGALELTGTGNVGTRPGQVALLGRINPTANAIQFYFDDFLWSAGGLPGAGQCAILLATGDGFYTGGSAVGAPTRWQAVDEVPPDGDSSYVQMNIGSASVSFLVGPAVDGLIHSVRAVIVERAPLSAASAKNRLRSGGVDLDSPARGTLTSYSSRHLMSDLDPGTGQPWLAAGVSTSEVGMVGAPSTNELLTSAYLMVDFLPTLAPGSMLSSVVASTLAPAPHMGGVLTAHAWPVTPTVGVTPVPGTQAGAQSPLPAPGRVILGGAVPGPAVSVPVTLPILVSSQPPSPYPGSASWVPPRPGVALSTLPGVVLIASAQAPSPAPGSVLLGVPPPLVNYPPGVTLIASAQAPRPFPGSVLLGGAIPTPETPGVTLLASAQSPPPAPGGVLASHAWPTPAVGDTPGVPLIARAQPPAPAPGSALWTPAYTTPAVSSPLGVTLIAQAQAPAPYPGAVITGHAWPAFVPPGVVLIAQAQAPAPYPGSVQVRGAIPTPETPGRAVIASAQAPSPYPGSALWVPPQPGAAPSILPGVVVLASTPAPSPHPGAVLTLVAFPERVDSPLPGLVLVARAQAPRPYPGSVLQGAASLTGATASQAPAPVSVVARAQAPSPYPGSALWTQNLNPIESVEPVEPPCPVRPLRTDEGATRPGRADQDSTRPLRKDECK